MLSPPCVAVAPVGGAVRPALLRDGGPFVGARLSAPAGGLERCCHPEVRCEDVPSNAAASSGRLTVRPRVSPTEESLCVIDQ